MKHLYILLLFASTAFAGLPSEDYTVDLTRESFRDGTLPTEHELYLNFQWVCGSYNTQPGTKTGTPGITLNEVFFTKINGQLINRSFYFPGKMPLVSNGSELTSQAINEDGNPIFFYTVRKNHGGLLVEVSIPVAGSPLVPSISSPEMSAAVYLYCLPFDFDSKAPKIMNYQWGDLYGKDFL